MATKIVKNSNKSKSSVNSLTKKAKDSKEEEKESLKNTKEPVKKEKSSKDNRGIYIAAIIFFSISLLLFGAIVSYFSTWKYDQSLNSLAQLFELKPDAVQNGMGKLGAITGNLLVGEWFGVFAMCIPLVFASFSMVLFRVKLVFYRKAMVSLTMIMLIGAVAVAYLTPDMVGTFGSSLGGGWGYNMSLWATNLFGEYGAGVVIFMFFALWLVYTSLAVVKYLGESIKIFIDKFASALSAIGLVFSSLFPKPKQRSRHYNTEDDFSIQHPTPFTDKQLNIDPTEEDIYEIEGDEVAQYNDENIDSEISITNNNIEDQQEENYVAKANMPSREATIFVGDYSQTIDKENLVIFNPYGYEDITMSSDKENNMRASMVDKFVVGEDFPIEIETPNNSPRAVSSEITPKSSVNDDKFEITGGFTAADDISKDSFEVSVTSNAHLDIESIPEGENIKITTNEVSEMDNIDVSVFDPTLELSSYKLPSVDLLDNHTSKVVVTEQELYENKNKILETLSNFNISIDKIKATIGPTVTLYEIKPAAGVRISKIKNLEDDIALSLSALGIRIIAPIPGKGTIGIEVPNKNKETVSMYSVIKSAKFQESTYDLPIVLGRTIQNDDFVIDLAKMPHLLVAGATGQGKSVGLNAIITSLLYKKHPSELKFVLVDPKKVELTLYANLEKHFLAKMGDEEEAIITDTQKVIYTLNSLCIEMDSRYKLLKTAKVRNIKEYNEKFTQRKLNPNNGHRFLPYFVVIIDEFADLIMTAGREIETPIARIAQLARAIGIHLVIATQRPTTNIITGVIKANFPARIAFRVSSMIDSRTILDQPGANQLIGRGDMLVSTGNEVVRVQCAFVDTPEVERITDYIGNQRGYSTAYQLPEYVPEGDAKNPDGGSMTGKLDEKFTEVARYVVQNQQGSASTIQRNFEVGFNRAGRIMDQLERSGIVGRQEGSKPRQVLINDMTTLELRLYDIENNN